MEMNSTKKTYEGMFLVDSGNSDIAVAGEPVRNILARYEADILALKLWDDRKLAYEIAGRKRGLYILGYFQMDPLKVREVEHDCRLDERILRVLLLRRDALTQEEINAETPATTRKVETPEAAPAEAVSREAVAAVEEPSLDPDTEAKE
jgi:small subunit ribosomal protein S6